MASSTQDPFIRKRPRPTTIYYLNISRAPELSLLHTTTMTVIAALISQTVLTIINAVLNSNFNLIWVTVLTCILRQGWNLEG